MSSRRLKAALAAVTRKRSRGGAANLDSTRYEGLNGTLLIRTDSIVIERDATLAHNNRLSPVWRVPLSQVTGVAFDAELTTGFGGRISIEVDGHPAPPPHSDSLRWDANSVTFSPRKSEAFGALSDWLLTVAEANRPLHLEDAGEAAQATPVSSDVEPALLEQEQVLPAAPVISLAWRGPAGWPRFDQGCPGSGFTPGPDLGDPHGHDCWTVVAPPEAVEAARVEAVLPPEWQESGPPSMAARHRWQVSTFHGRVDLLNDVETALCKWLFLANDWETDDQDSSLGVRVPPTHPAVEARRRAWEQTALACRGARLAAARDLDRR
jgi:hypothetical protein